MESKLAIGILIFAVSSLAEPADKKWVWKENGRDSRYFSQDIDASRRYEVTEEEKSYLSNYRPGRPSGPSFIPNRPTNGYFVPQERPGGVYGPNYLSGGYGQDGDRYPGVLTGPVPSWEREPAFKNFDRCKCTEKFNCNTPGFSYGHCDIGKQYCCYSTKLNNGNSGGPIPGRPIHSIDNGILVGPGGPVDYPDSPYPNRPGFGRPIGSGVLIGPGGPTGVVGRPGSYSYRPPTGLGTYGRSASKEDNE